MNAVMNNFAMISQPSQAPSSVETSGTVALFGGAETSGSVASSSCGGSSGSFSTIA